MDTECHFKSFQNAYRGSFSFSLFLLSFLVRVIGSLILYKPCVSRTNHFIVITHHAYRTWCSISWSLGFWHRFLGLTWTFAIKISISHSPSTVSLLQFIWILPLLELDAQFMDFYILNSCWRSPFIHSEDRDFFPSSRVRTEPSLSAMWRTLQGLGFMWQNAPSP